MVTTNDTLGLEFGASKVSGFYGPGSLIAWWMQCAGFAFDICLKPESTPPPHLSQQIRSFARKLFWSSLSLSIVAGFPYIAQRDLRQAAHDKRSTASFHAPVAVLLQYNLITFLFLALTLGRLSYGIWESYVIHPRINDDGNIQNDRINAIKFRVALKELSFMFSTVVILLPRVLLNNTKALVDNTLRDCSALEDPSTNSSRTCLENYAMFLDTYVPGKSGSTEYLISKAYPVPRSIDILTYFLGSVPLASFAINQTSSYRLSWRDSPGWRGKFAVVDSAVRVFTMKDWVNNFAFRLFCLRYSSNIIAPDAIMWIVYGRARGLIPLTTASLSDQDQLAAVALGGLAFLSSQKDLILRFWGLIEKFFFAIFNCDPTLKEAIVELEPAGILNNNMSQPDQDGHGRARDRSPKT